MAGRGWALTSDVGAFANELGELPDGFDECGVVASTGEVHGGFEFASEGGVKLAKGTADVDLHGVDAGLVTSDGGLHFGIRSHFAPPLSTHGVDRGLGGLGSFDHLLSMKLDELLGLVLGETQLFKDWGDCFNELGVKLKTFRGLEVCILLRRD